MVGRDHSSPFAGYDTASSAPKRFASDQPASLCFVKSPQDLSEQGLLRAVTVVGYASGSALPANGCRIEKMTMFVWEVVIQYLRKHGIRGAVVRQKNMSTCDGMSLTTKSLESYVGCRCVFRSVSETDE
jgi:hypothetical protein